MIDNIAIDIAIGLTLMYLMLSLACTVINEFIATQLDLRAKSLHAGLIELLDDPTVRQAFYAQGVISGTRMALTNSGRMLWYAIRGVRPSAAPPEAPVDHPSYMSADSFVSGMIGALTTGSMAAGQSAPTFDDLKAAVEKLPPSQIKGALLTKLTTAQNDLVKFRLGLATWFDDSMERVSGAYKRHLRLITIFVALAIAVALNADTFAVGYALWANPALRAQMVAVSEQTQKNALPNPSGATPTDVATALANANNALRPMLPVGWPLTPPGDGPLWWFWLVKALGWIVTGLALSLGAPFWFDTLSKFINIRGAGPKPERADAKLLPVAVKT
ncbi:MAG TPA: hypothetical protein VE909_01480 [Xanthobacteraceae bacterium]|nr:hypothetical protein [Xanthobacteraceae bacterium]